MEGTEAGKETVGEGVDGAAAVYSVYMQQYAVDHVCLLMSLAEDAELAHTQSG